MASRIGIIGTGDIAGAYMTLSRQFSGFEIVACASRSLESAKRFADRHQLLPQTVDGMLECKSDVAAILNLTPPANYYAISHAALENGIHVFRKSLSQLHLRTDNTWLASPMTGPCGWEWHRIHFWALRFSAPEIWSMTR